jgi:thiol-disulfide isomerase/thioredoxin
MAWGQTIVEEHVTRTVMTLVLATLALSACESPESAAKFADLEKRIVAIEDAQKNAPKGPAAPANSADELAAGELFKTATKAAEDMKYDDAKAKLAELQTKYPNSRAARAAQRLNDELSVIGKPVAGLDVAKWYQGELAAVEGTTLLVFWEVWCPHCKREVPKMTGIADKYKDKGLTVVGLTKQSRGITDEQVSSFISDNNVTYPMAKEKEDGKISQHYGVKGIPAAAVVKDGKVVWRGHPARINDAMLDGWTGS